MAVMTVVMVTAMTPVVQAQEPVVQAALEERAAIVRA